MALVPTAAPDDPVWDRPFRSTFNARTRVLTVGGAIDEAADELLENAIRTHSSDYTLRLTVDLSDVDLLPSRAVRVLAVAWSRSAGSLELVARDGCIARRVLQVSGIPCRTLRAR